jgi:hypothetical protein
MVDRRLERQRSDKGRYMSADEIRAAEIAKQDATMNKFIVSRVRGPNSSRARLTRKIFGNPLEEKQ